MVLCSDSILLVEWGLCVVEEEGGWYVILRGVLILFKDCWGEEERRLEMELELGWFKGISWIGKICLCVVFVWYVWIVSFWFKK